MPTALVAHMATRPHPGLPMHLTVNEAAQEVEHQATIHPLIPCCWRRSEGGSDLPPATENGRELILMIELKGAELGHPPEWNAHRLRLPLTAGSRDTGRAVKVTCEQ